MPFVTIKRRRSFLGVLVPEIIVIVFAALAVYLYSYFDLPLRNPPKLYWQRIQGGLPCYLLGLLVALCFIRLAHIRAGRKQKQFVPPVFTWKTFKDNFLRRPLVLRDLRYINITCLMFVVFVNLKHLIPHINPNLADEPLLRFERSMFGGKLAAQAVISQIGLDWAALLSESYMLFYPYVALVIYIFIIQRNSDLTEEFLSAMFLVWFLGMCAVYALPSLGPIFAAPNLFSMLPATGVSDMQLKLWQHKEILESMPEHRGAVYLISGFPSLHLAVPVLGSIYLKRVHLLFAVLSWLFCALTVITTLYFGWHYLLDDVGAVVLALCAWKLVRRYYALYYVYVNDPPFPPVRNP